MFGKLVVSVVACLALANGNPAAGKEWTWKSRMPVVDPITGNISHPESTARIVGGTEATPHAWPHQVGLFLDGLYFCGGSLISGEWVLTAGHCTDGASSVEVVMGAHNILENEATQVSMTSTHIITHESYNYYTLANDIGLVKLPSPVTFNENIYSVALSHTDVEVGTIVTLTGWGKDSDSSSTITSNLRQVNNPVITEADCASVYGSMIDQKIVCTDTTGGKGTCSGDSGGPMNYNGMTYGVTSFVSSAGCEAGYPAGFTRLLEFLDWIAAQTGIN